MDVFIFYYPGKQTVGSAENGTGELCGGAEISKGADFADSRFAPASGFAAVRHEVKEEPME